MYFVKLIAMARIKHLVPFKAQLRTILVIIARNMSTTRQHFFPRLLNEIGLLLNLTKNEENELLCTSTLTC